MTEEPGTVRETNTDDAIHETPEEEVPTTDETSAVHSRTQATEIKRPGAGRRISYSLSSRESRAGRFFRGLLRWLLILAVLLGVGFFLGYYFFFMPAQQSLNQLSVRATESAVDLQRAQKELEEAQAGLTSAQKSEKTAQDQLGLELTRVQVLRAVVSLRAAQTAVATEDAAAAEEHVASAQETVQQSQASLDRIDSDASSNIQALFTLVRNGLDSNPEVASQDLERLIAELERLESALK